MTSSESKAVPGEHLVSIEQKIEVHDTGKVTLVIRRFTQIQFELPHTIYKIGWRKACLQLDDSVDEIPSVVRESHRFGFVWA